jgi:exoribonuclease-2
VEQGALIFSLPEAIIHVGDDSSLSIEMISQDTPSRMMVAELMILYNWLAARLCRDHNIPIIYRGQKEPSERLTIEETGYVYYVFRQRRKLFPLVIDIDPIPHAGLGLDIYSNLTSPIRRYFDLVSQRQIRNYLLGGTPFYNREELEKIRLAVTTSLKDLNIVKINRIRYWIVKYLGEHIGEEFPAIVLDVMKSKFRVILENFLFVAEMKREAGQDLSHGQKIKVRIKKADHFEDLLKIDLVDVVD